MTQEEKELLLKDLCARLPYGVKVNIRSKKSADVATVCEITRNYISIEGGGEMCFSHGSYKPYLRPMSSMTEKDKDIYEYNRNSNVEVVRTALFDWLNERHFDYRGLIPRGLALEAPEGMYNIKTTCDNCEDKSYCSQSEYVKNNCYKLK